MDNKLYKMMNWPEIESVVYSECKYPQNILGCHEIQGGFLIQAFFPGAESVKVRNLKTEAETLMECVDEEGFFAIHIAGKTAFTYEYLVTEAGQEHVKPEVYGFIPSFWGDLSQKLDAGILYDSYKYFGAHFAERKGILGTEFITYAPNAERVSVVGDFNGWDGRVHQMCCIDERGVFGIFIPGLPVGALYKFEVKLSSGLTYLKRDPFAFELEKGEGDACVVSTRVKSDRAIYKRTEMPDRFTMLSIGPDELYNTEESTECEGDSLFSKIKEAGCDCVLFPDITKCDLKAVTDNGTVSFFATNPSLFPVTELSKLVSELHKEGIRVFLTLEPSGFIADNGGLRGYDGTRLFEGNEKEISGRFSFDWTKPFVRNFLISACDYFVDLLDADGLCIGGTDRILYLDYGKFDGEWLPNIYGGNENLYGIEFLKHLNSILHKRYPGIVTVAKDSMVSNNLTLSLEEGGLGFDYKIHTQFDKDLVRYMNRDINGRKQFYSELTFSPVYIYCERFILSLLNEDYGRSEARLSSGFSFDEDGKRANLRLLLSYMFMHPGRKCLPFTDVKDDKLKVLLQTLSELYKTRDEFSNDDFSDGFEWVNAVESEQCVVSFLRKSKDKNLLIIANFSDKPLNFRMGLEEGSYKEIFASEQIKFGGNYKLSGRSKQTSKVRCDGKETSLSVKLQPFGVHVYEKTGAD